MKRWTELEEQNLRELSKTMTARELADALGRTKFSVYTKIRSMGISIKKTWTDEQVQFLINSSKTMTARELAAALGKTRAAVWYKMRHLGLELKRDGGGAQCRTFSRREREIMRDYENFSNRELAEMLGRTIYSIRGFAQRNFLTRKQWTLDETAMLRELAASTPVKELAVIFQRSHGAIRMKCLKEGIECSPRARQ